jgi:nucleotide-binding universal stress UspA family protein
VTVAVAHQHSQTSKAVLSHGAREAKLRQTDLVVINIVEALDLDARAALEAGLGDEIQQVLDDSGLGDVAWTLQLGAEDEDVAGAVISAAGAVDAEVLVIGARRRSPLGKFLLGSATQTIILDAPMPVLVIKGDPA